MQELVKTGKYTEINKQSDVKFWLNYIKFGAVSHLLSCTWQFGKIELLQIAQNLVMLTLY